MTVSFGDSRANVRAAFRAVSSRATTHSSAPWRETFRHLDDSRARSRGPEATLDPRFFFRIIARERVEMRQRWGTREKGMFHDIRPLRLSKSRL